MIERVVSTFDEFLAGDDVLMTPDYLRDLKIGDSVEAREIVGQPAYQSSFGIKDGSLRIVMHQPIPVLDLDFVVLFRGVPSRVDWKDSNEASRVGWKKNMVVTAIGPKVVGRKSGGYAKAYCFVDEKGI